MAASPGSVPISSSRSAPPSPRPARETTGKLYGRRKGRPLSRRRAEIVAERADALRIDVSLAPPANCRALFPIDVGDVRMEIGCGAGEHLVANALLEPTAGFIGVEPFEEGFGRTVAAIAQADCRNARLFDGDAAILLDWLPAASLTLIELPYPDPWPKRRHWKRRFISDANLDRMARTVVPGGLLRVATDIADYADWTLLKVKRHGAFEWTAARADDWRLPWDGWPGTRYEAKAKKAGRRPTYLEFRRR